MEQEKEEVPCESKKTPSSWILCIGALLAAFGLGLWSGYSVGDRQSESRQLTPFDGMRCAEILGRLQNLKNQSEELRKEVSKKLDTLSFALDKLRVLEDMQKDFSKWAHTCQSQGISSFPNEISPQSDDTQGTSSPSPEVELEAQLQAEDERG